MRHKTLQIHILPNIIQHGDGVMLYYTRNMWLYVCWKQDSIIGPVVSCVISVSTSNTIFGSLCSFLKSAKDSKFFLHSAGMEAQYSKILTYIVLQFFKVPSKTFWNQPIYIYIKTKKTLFGLNWVHISFKDAFSLNQIWRTSW